MIIKNKTTPNMESHQKKKKKSDCQGINFQNLVFNF